jgi:hypothetical protein
MNLQEAIAVLETHNQWRRGEHDRETDPTLLGQAIDAVVTHRHAIPPPDAIRDVAEALSLCAYPNITGGESAVILNTLIARQDIARSALTRLRALLEGAPEGPTDKEMLDWLERADVTIQFNTLDCLRARAPHFERGPTIRSAIAAAMKEERKS